MKISNYIEPNRIFLNIRLPDKTSVLEFIADTCTEHRLVTDRETLYRALLAREETMSTGIGNGIALPHAVNEKADQAAVLLIRPDHPIDFNAIDSLPVDIIVALVIPQNRTTLHIQILAAVSRLCKNPGFAAAFRKAEEACELADEIMRLESKMRFH
ncbi:MAG: PTS sugar transporter subunit IIA [Desulfobacterales bacterium]